MHTGVDLLIEANSMNPRQTSIIANTSKENKEELISFADEVAKPYEVTFRHNTGFIRVLNVSSEEFAKDFKAKFQKSRGRSNRS